LTRVTYFGVPDRSTLWKWVDIDIDPAGNVWVKGNVWVTNRFGNSKRGEKVLGEMLAAAKAGKSIDVPPLTRKTASGSRTQPPTGSLVGAMIVQRAGPVTRLCGPSYGPFSGSRLWVRS
jgi:hypothetical protein